MADRGGLVIHELGPGFHRQVVGFTFVSTIGDVVELDGRHVLVGLTFDHGPVEHGLHAYLWTGFEFLDGQTRVLLRIPWEILEFVANDSEKLRHTLFLLRPVLVYFTLLLTTVVRNLLVNCINLFVGAVNIFIDCVLIGSLTQTLLEA